jgi:hypothetical protein
MEKRRFFEKTLHIPLTQPVGHGIISLCRREQDAEKKESSEAVKSQERVKQLSLN